MVPRRAAAVLLLPLVLAPLPAVPQARLGQEQAEGAARVFGEALTGGDTARVRSILPREGKVRMNVVCLGPEQGSFSAGQVEALLKDFLRQGRVRSFAIDSAESEPGRYALVHARAAVTDRDGSAASLQVHLTFQPEDGRWVLREIREAPP
jgi:hypothetical protein